jgi:hypothetical protein
MGLFSVMVMGVSSVMFLVWHGKMGSYMRRRVRDAGTGYRRLDDLRFDDWLLTAKINWKV